MKTYLNWSGGKDSTASLIIAYEKKIQLDGIVFCEVMFDNQRKISGENPEHIKFIKEEAIPLIKQKFGYKVYIVKAKSDYITEFNIINKSGTYAGKKRGFFIGGMCKGNSKLKIEPLNNFYKTKQPCMQIIGIAIDETERLKRLKENQISLLEKYKITEKECYKICKEYHLLSPIYETETRGGCWFCPNAKMREWANLKKLHPKLWEELEILSHTENIATKNFKYGKSFNEVNKELDMINNQICMF